MFSYINKTIMQQWQAVYSFHSGPVLLFRPLHFMQTLYIGLQEIDFYLLTFTYLFVSHADRMETDFV